MQRKRAETAVGRRTDPPEGYGDRPGFYASAFALLEPGGLEALAVREAVRAGQPVVDEVTAALAQAYAVARRRMAWSDADLLLGSLRRHAGHVAEMARVRRRDEVDRRLLGPVGALVASVQRRERAQARRRADRMDELYARVHGRDRLELERLRRRVDAACGGGAVGGVLSR